jgi:hypothetical protein
MIMKELRSISSIFRRNENRQYDEYALLYRDILCYPIKVANMNGDHTVKDGSINTKYATFTRWRIVNWLRSNHSIYVTRYCEHPLDSNYDELMSIQNTVKRNLNRLVEIELLQVQGEEKIQKGTGTTPIYKPRPVSINYLTSISS